MKNFMMILITMMFTASAYADIAFDTSTVFSTRVENGQWTGTLISNDNLSGTGAGESIIIGANVGACKGVVFAELHDSSGVVKKYNHDNRVQIRLKLVTAGNEGEDSFTDGANAAILVHNVDPTSFATGKIVLRAAGNCASVSAGFGGQDNAATPNQGLYESREMGKGTTKLEFPFTVTP